MKYKFREVWVNYGPYGVVQGVYTTKLDALAAAKYDTVRLAIKLKVAANEPKEGAAKP
jgi:hypothetical protein